MADLPSLLWRGAAAGAGAGLLTALFHLVFTEPVLERAIALEGGSDGPVSREMQRYVGGPLGQLVFGVSIGLLFALAYRAVPSAASAWHKATGLAFAAYLVVALIPQLRFPADPPGVGDPETIGTRTWSYLLTYALGLVVVVGGYVALRALSRRGVGEAARQSLVVAAGLGVVLVGYALLPGSGESAGAPAELVWDFRIRALGGLTLFFATLGAIFGALCDRADAPTDARRELVEVVR